MSVSLEQLVYQAVIGNASITSLLGTDAGGNVTFYDKALPQQGNIYPAGVYQRVASPRLFVMDPANQANVGRARFMLVFWGYSTAVLAQIDLAVLVMFRTFDAYNPPGSPPTFIQASLLAYSSRTLIEPQTQPPLQKIEIDVTFWFSDQS